MSRSRENWYFVLVMAVVAVIIGRPSSSLSKPPAETLVDTTGFLLVLAGVMIRAASRDWKIAHGSKFLVTDGPYGIVRNPMYLGSLLAGFGLCLIFGSVLLTLAFILAFVVVHQIIVRREQRFLRWKFGEEYDNYTARVPAWLPSVFGMCRLVFNSFSWMKSVPAALVRERNAIVGNLAGAMVVEALADSMAMGWRASRGEAVMWMAGALAVIAAGAAAGALFRSADTGAA